MSACAKAVRSESMVRRRRSMQPIWSKICKAQSIDLNRAVIARRQIRGEKGCQGFVSFEYAVSLTSDEASYSGDRLVLEQVLTSWKPIRETAIQIAD